MLPSGRSDTSETSSHVPTGSVPPSSFDMSYPKTVLRSMSDLMMPLQHPPPNTDTAAVAWRLTNLAGFPGECACCRYRRVSITSAVREASNVPLPKLSAIALAAACVASRRPVGASASISARIGEPWQRPIAIDIGDAA